MSHFAAHSPDLQKFGPRVRLDLAVDAELETFLRSLGQPVSDPQNVTALIDTGSEITVIDAGVPRDLGLHQSGFQDLSSPGGALDRCPAYDARLLLPNGGVWHGRVVEAPIRKSLKIDCVIGRDLLAGAMFWYIGHEELFGLVMIEPADDETTGDAGGEVAVRVEGAGGIDT